MSSGQSRKRKVMEEAGQLHEYQAEQRAKRAASTVPHAPTGVPSVKQLEAPQPEEVLEGENKVFRIFHVLSK